MPVVATAIVALGGVGEWEMLNSPAMASVSSAVRVVFNIVFVWKKGACFEKGEFLRFSKFFLKKYSWERFLSWKDLCCAANAMASCNPRGEEWRCVLFVRRCGLFSPLVRKRGLLIQVSLFLSLFLHYCRLLFIVSGCKIAANNFCAHANVHAGITLRVYHTRTPLDQPLCATR